MITKTKFQKFIDYAIIACLPVFAFIALQVYSTDGKITDVRTRVEKIEWFLIANPQIQKTANTSKRYDSLKLTVYEKSCFGTKEK